MRKVLPARIGRERTAEANDLEGEHCRDRYGDARDGRGPCPHPLARRRPRSGEKRQERERDEEEVHDLREGEKAGEKPRGEGEPERRPSFRPPRAGRERHGENETDRLQRLGESARRVRPERRGERRPEHGEPLAEEARAERPREEACPRRRRCHEEDLQENEQRLRRPRAETCLPWARHEGERHLEQRKAHAVGRHRVARRPRDGERLPARDPELAGRGDRDRGVEHLLLVGDGPERALFGRPREQEKGGEDRKAERPRGPLQG
jgi:hypothetical protein